jgi:hypothetical protein
MNFEKFGDSSNFLIWIVLIAIVFGFGKCRELLDVNFVKVNEGGNAKQQCGHNRNVYVNKRGNDLNRILGGNGLFIILVIALLFLCKDKKEEYKEKDFDEVEDLCDI